MSENKGISERDLLEKLRAYATFRRYLNPSLIDFIDQVQSYEYIPEITRVSEDMDIHASTVWKFMNLLRNKGLKFIGIVDISRLNAEEIIIVFDEYIPYEKVFKGLLREYAPALPLGTYMKYIVPKGLAEAFLNELIPSLPKEPRVVYRLPYTVVGKPNLKRYYDISSREIIIDWDETLKIIESSPKESVPKENRRKGRFDEIDIFILRKLETSPFDSLRKITEELNKELKPITPINYIRILRHYKNHIEARGVIRGVKLDVTPLYAVDTVPLKVTLSGNPAEILRIIKVMITHPYFPEASMNPSDNIAILTAFVPINELFELSSFLEKLRGKGMIREWRITYLDYPRYRKLALPIRLFSDSIQNIMKMSEDQFLVEEISMHPTLPSIEQLMRGRKGRLRR